MIIIKLLLIDGNSIINRAFYGIKLLTTKDGKYTNGIFGFLNILLSLLDSIKPDAVVAAFDLKGPTFRHEMYEGYKAQRKGMPDELAQQLPVLKDLLRAFGYKVIEKEGYEADDIIGTLSDKSGAECYIATGDRDSLQLVNDRVKVILASTKAGSPVSTVYDEAKILEEYSVSPERLIDIKALMGDSSDNIPGVAGIGQKTACSLVAKYGSLEEIYDKIEELEVSPSVKTKLKEGRDSAFLSYKLGTIEKAVPISHKAEDYLPDKRDETRLAGLLTSLEMYKMLDRLGLKAASLPAAEEKIQPLKTLRLVTDFDAAELIKRVKESKKLYLNIDSIDNKINRFCVNCDDSLYFKLLDNQDAQNLLKGLLSDADTEKHFNSSKALHYFGFENGFNIENVESDVQLAGYLINPNVSDYSVNTLAAEHGAAIPEIIVSENEQDLYERNIAFIESAAHLPAVCEMTGKVLADLGQTELYSDIELPLARVLANMELVGFEVDAKGIEGFGADISAKLDDITNRIYTFAGQEFNINSPKQLGEVLFDKLKLPVRKKTKSGYSTNAEVLESLRFEHPIIPDILEYRTLAKLKSTYCDSLIREIRSDGRIHSTLNQTETRTGRISSTDPNLQNIPVRQDLGRELRRFFKAKDGWVLVDADYSQIELRVLAHMANDEAMLEAFNNGDDIHAITASQVFKMPLDMVTPLMRSRAKAVNFGIVYGIGAFSLSQDIGVSVAEADRYIKAYLGHYAGVARFMKTAVENAKERGYATTIFNRRRYLPELKSSNANLRSFGERVAMNMPIQGTAADIIKLAMIKVHHRFVKEGMQARLIMQVHDELIVEAPENEKERAAEILKNEMENAVKLKVKLTADVNTGKTWYDAKG